MADLPPLLQRTASEWELIDPFLPRRMLAIESDTGKSKVGVGIKWSDTPYSPDVVSNQITTIVSLTQAEYDGLSSKDGNTLYVIS
jgi:hypothetical protein